MVCFELGCVCYLAVTNVAEQTCTAGATSGKPQAKTADTLTDNLAMLVHKHAHFHATCPTPATA